ncbi:acetyl-CoA C-acetyltransferase [Malassezia sp. CBS 17886]|nr:acetyl-CoA C-acetyltransferase [Malassezia sp. CBS 17886]
MNMEDVFVVSMVRTPTGAFQGALRTQPAVDLGVVAARAAMERAGVLPEDVEEAYFGCVLQADIGQAPARQVVLRAGCPVSTEATTVNKVCASGMKALAFATQSIQLGERSIMLAGGMESMSNAPYYLPRGGLSYGDAAARDAILRDGLHGALDGKHMGLCAEATAEKHGISREQQDAFAVDSYERAAAAWRDGLFQQEVVPVAVKDKRGETLVGEDEGYGKLRKDKMPTLRPAFLNGGTVTAANASGLNDGASALVLASGSEVQRRGLTPLARIVATADAACAPVDFPTAPSLVVQRVLKRADLSVDQIALWEINEAFAVVVLANAQILGLDLAKVNVRGGAVSLGHPIGSSGARIVVTLAHALKEGEYGVATKRTLAEAFQASLDEDTRAHEPPEVTAPAPSATHTAATPQEPDYMSDALLSDLPSTREALITYTQQRNHALVHQGMHQWEMRAAASERQAFRRQRGPLSGELAARARGLSENVIDRVALATEQEKAEVPAVGSGSAAALNMMMAMGYERGSALGKDAGASHGERTDSEAGGTRGRPNDAAQIQPLRPDERWSKQVRAAPSAHRVGIGHADLSTRIAQAAEASEPAVDVEERATQFRAHQARIAELGRHETQLRSARRILRELDEDAGIEYSPLWLDPTSLPQGHTLYQAPVTRAHNERGEEDAVALLALALVGEGESDETEKRQRGRETRGASPPHDTPGGEERDTTERPAAPEDSDTRETMRATDRAASSRPPSPRRISSRQRDAERFCRLPAHARLELTAAVLRDVYLFCLYCGQRYEGCAELERECPGLTEDDHE